MAITMRKGNEEDFNENRLVAGELAVVLDQEEMYVKFGSTTKKLMTEEDAELMIASQIEEVQEELEDEIEALDTSVSGKLDKSNPTGTGSISFQRKAGTTTGVNSVALGMNNSASGYGSAAIGGGNESSQEYAVALGTGTKTSGAGCVAVGKYNKVGLNQRVFDVGSGTSNDERNSAFYIEADGSSVFEENVTFNDSVTFNEDVTFNGDINAPVFNYSSTPVLIGHQGAMPIMRKTVMGTNTTQWSAHTTNIMDLGTKYIMALNLYGYIRCNPEDQLIVNYPISMDLCVEDNYVRLLSNTLPGFAKQSSAIYCVTAEYILLTT